MKTVPNGPSLFCVSLKLGIQGLQFQEGRRRIAMKDPNVGTGLDT